MRRLAASILAMAFLVLSAAPAFGAVVIDQSKLNELKALTQEMTTIKVKIIEKKVEAGILDRAKADKIKKAVQERQQKIEQNIDKGEFHGQGGFEHKKGSGPKHLDSPQKTE